MSVFVCDSGNIGGNVYYIQRISHQSTLLHIYQLIPDFPSLQMSNTEKLFTFLTFPQCLLQKVMLSLQFDNEIAAVQVLFVFL